MKCPRCGRRSPGASWYCAHCGQAFPDVHVADGSPGPLGRSWRTWLGLGGLALLLLAGTAAFYPMLAGRRAPATPTPSAPAVVAGAPSPPAATPTPAPRPTPRIVTAAPGGGTAGPGTGSPSPTAGAATPTLERGQPVWRIGHLRPPPRLDGLLDEWYGPWLAIPAVVFGAQHRSGPADLSARAQAAYDQEHLYLAIDVTDDLLSQPERGQRLYLGDYVEVQLDADLNGDREVAEHNADDFQIGLSPGNFAGRGPEATVWRPAGATATGIHLAARRTPAGYGLEAAIPWRLLGVDPTRTSTLGLALNVSDNDLAEPAQLTMISSTPNRDWSDPRSFGTLVLEALGGLVAPPP